MTFRTLAIRSVYAIGLFLLANIVVYAWSGFFDRAKLYYAFVSGARQPDVTGIMLGDSHVANVRQQFLGSHTRNVAFGGDGYRECYAKLRYLIEKVPSLRTAWISVDYHMFGTGRVESSNRSFADRYLLLTASPVGYEKGWLSAAFNLVPLLNDDFVQYLKKDLRVKLQSFQGERAEAPEVWSDLTADKREQQAAVMGRGDYAGLGKEEAPLVWYARIVELARTHGVELISVRFPVDRTYLAQAPPEGKRVVDDALDDLGVQPVDMTRVFSDPRYFEDEDHVNNRGAAALVCLLEARTGHEIASRDTAGCSGVGLASLASRGP